MQLFDFLPHLFSDSKKYDSLNNNERAKFFFMTNRFFAIKFPHVANNFNHLEINTGQSINSWHDMFKRAGSIPGWLWAGIKKNKVGTTKKEFKFSCTDEQEQMYCSLYNISYKEFKRLVELYPKELQKEINELQDSVDQKIKKSK